MITTASEAFKMQEDKKKKYLAEEFEVNVDELERVFNSKIKGLAWDKNEVGMFRSVKYNDGSEGSFTNHELATFADRAAQAGYIVKQEHMYYMISIPEPEVPKKPSWFSKLFNKENK